MTVSVYQSDCGCIYAIPCCFLSLRRKIHGKEKMRTDFFRIEKRLLQRSMKTFSFLFNFAVEIKTDAASAARRREDGISAENRAASMHGQECMWNSIYKVYAYCLWWPGREYREDGRLIRACEAQQLVLLCRHVIFHASFTAINTIPTTSNSSRHFSFGYISF